MEGKSLNFENILTWLPVMSILLTTLCDQDIICSTRVSYQVNSNNMCYLFLVNSELNSRTPSAVFHCTVYIIHSCWCWFLLSICFCCACKYELPIINRLELAGSNIVCWVQSKIIYLLRGNVNELSCVSNTLQNFKSHFDMLSLIKPRSSIKLYKGSEVDLAASLHSLHSCYLFIYLFIYCYLLERCNEQ